MRFGATRSQIYDPQQTARARWAAASQAASDRAGREATRARRANAAAREQDLGAVDAAHAAAARDIAGRADVDQFAANRARDEKRSAVTQKYREAEQRGRGEYQ